MISPEELLREIGGPEEEDTAITITDLEEQYKLGRSYEKQVQERQLAPLLRVVEGLIEHPNDAALAVVAVAMEVFNGQRAALEEE